MASICHFNTLVTRRKSSKGSTITGSM
jgi:hypothetical protein